jgi:hypothetical protein
MRRKDWTCRNMERKATNGRIDPGVLTLSPTHSAENAEWMGHPQFLGRGVLLGSGVHLFLRAGVAAVTGGGVLCYSLPEGRARG